MYASFLCLSLARNSSCHFLIFCMWKFLKITLEKVVLKNQSPPRPFSPGLSPKEFFQADASRCQNMLSWRQWLWSCHFLSCLFSRSWTPPSHNHYSRDPAFAFPVCDCEVQQSISRAGSCIMLRGTTRENFQKEPDGDFQDKLKEFHTEILEKYIFHLCKYSLFKLNKFSYITTWCTPAFARTVIFYVVGFVIRKWDRLGKKL